MGGTGADILIAGSTKYENDMFLTAWRAIQAHWVAADLSTDAAFAAEVNTLSGATSTFAYKLDQTTVHSDRAIDVL
jgi:hypothetical protein